MTTTEHPTAPRIARELVEPDPNQPRKHFDKAKLQELADSIAEHDVITPLVLRPHPKKNSGHMMIIEGERRWRAAELVGLKDLPYVVRDDVDDKLALELQLIANGQRDDLQPLEEAETFQRLIDDHGHDPDTLAAKTGKSKSHVYGRLRLMKLSPAVKKLVANGTLSPMIAGLAATIRVPKMQEQYVDDVLGTWKNDDGTREDALQDAGIESEQLGDQAKPMYQQEGRRQPLSFRASQALLHRKYSTRLALAKFPVADAALVPEAGACTACPKRSGNQPELFPDLAEPEDVCTDAACFQKKTEAVWKSAKLDAKSRGIDVVEGDDAKDLFTYDGHTATKSPYIDPAAKLPYNLQKSPGQESTWKKLLGKRLDEVPKKLAQDLSGAPRELIDQKKAIEILREMKKIDSPASAKGSGGATSERTHYEKERKKDEAKRELNTAALLRVLEQVAEKAGGELSDQKELALLRWAVRGYIADYADTGGDTAEAILVRRGLENYDVLEQQVEDAKGIGQVRAIFIEFMFALVSEGRVRSFDVSHRKKFDEGLKILGIDWDRAFAAAKEAAKAEAAAEAAAKADKKPAKKGKGK